VDDEDSEQSKPISICLFMELCDGSIRKIGFGNSFTLDQHDLIVNEFKFNFQVIAYEMNISHRMDVKTK
jgi:hypothetical protein